MSLSRVLLDLTTLAVGYLLGTTHPLRAGRAWARFYLRYRYPDDLGRLRHLRMATVAALLPDTFARVIWDRVRHGQWPGPPAPRTSRVPVMIVRRKTRDQPGDQEGTT